MSREFGDHCGGFFHDKVRGAAEDAETGRHEITKAVGGLLQALYPLAYAISSAEACDSSEPDPLMRALEQGPKMRDTLDEIAACCRTHRDMMIERSAKDVAVFLVWSFDEKRRTLAAKVPRAARRSGLDYAHWRDVLDRCARAEWQRRGLDGWATSAGAMSVGGDRVLQRRPHAPGGCGAKDARHARRGSHGRSPRDA